MLGIIGGIGPTAGADLLQKITEETKATKDQEHLPVILFSLPQDIEDRTEYLRGEVDENPGIQIANIALQLFKLGVTIAGVPCNTAHAPKIFNCIQNELDKNNSKLKIVHMINESVRYLEKHFHKGSRIGVLSTTGTYEQRIYASKIEEAGFLPSVPAEKVQHDVVHAAIYHPEYGIKTNNGKVTATAKSKLEEAMNILNKDGAEAIILGCTELPLAFKEKEYGGMQLIDATRILARAMIREYDASKLKDEE
ncbi:MAG: aspartate/glutamate racemase family protein [Chitinophagaceae bacterium]|nr:aspartate/glutamate racemase family protein [Chitinophagaceae bacterium]